MLRAKGKECALFGSSMSVACIHWRCNVHPCEANSNPHENGLSCWYFPPWTMGLQDRAWSNLNFRNDSGWKQPHDHRLSDWGTTTFMCRGPRMVLLTSVWRGSDASFVVSKLCHFRADAHRWLRRISWPSMSSQGGIESYWMRTCCFRNIFFVLFGTYSCNHGTAVFLGAIWKACSRKLLRRVFPTDLPPISNSHSV